MYRLFHRSGFLHHETGRHKSLFHIPPLPLRIKTDRTFYNCWSDCLMIGLFIAYFVSLILLLTVSHHVHLINPYNLIGPPS